MTDAGWLRVVEASGPPLSPRVERWFSSYAQDHHHPTNQRIHKLAVPVIVWSVVAAVLLRAWPPPPGQGVKSLQTH